MSPEPGASRARKPCLERRWRMGPLCCRRRNDDRVSVPAEPEPKAKSAYLFGGGGGRGDGLPHGGDRQDPHYAGDLPVLVHTLRVFEDCPDIAEVVVVTREDLLVEVSRLCREFDLEKVSKVVVGGEPNLLRSGPAWRRCVRTRSSSPSTMGPAPAAAPEVLQEVLDRGTATGRRPRPSR